MKPDWDELGDKFDGSKKVLIGDVDCTKDTSKELCEKQGVKGYPTIKYYTPGDPNGQTYEGERDLKSLKKFAKTLGPACSALHPGRCSKEEKAKLDEYMAMPADELMSKHNKAVEEWETKKAAHEALMKSLQEQYEASNKEVEALKALLEPEIKLMSGAMLKPPAEKPAA